MKKMLLLSGLLLVAAFSCIRGDDFSNSMLTGEWTLSSSDFDAQYSPTLFFSTDGKYSQTVILKLSPYQSLLMAQYTVTGEYVFDEGKITFNTAVVDFPDGTNDYPYGYDDTPLMPGSSIGLWWSGTYRGSHDDEVGLAAEFSPVTWEVIELSASTLKVSSSPGSVMVYTR